MLEARRQPGSCPGGSGARGSTGLEAARRPRPGSSPAVPRLGHWESARLAHTSGLKKDFKKWSKTAVQPHRTSPNKQISSPKKSSVRRAPLSLPDTKTRRLSSSPGRSGRRLRAPPPGAYGARGYRARLPAAGALRHFRGGGRARRGASEAFRARPCDMLTLRLPAAVRAGVRARPGLKSAPPARTQPLRPPAPS